MRHMKQAQYREKLRESSPAELEQMLADERKSLFMSNRDSATKQIENPKKIMQSRKNIARILTVQRERELASAKGTE